MNSKISAAAVVLFCKMTTKKNKLKMRKSYSKEINASCVFQSLKENI